MAQSLLPVILTKGLYYKTLRFCNLPEKDRFCSKLVSSGLDKHVSVSKQKHHLTME